MPREATSRASERGQPDQAGLGGGIIHLARLPGAAHHAGHIHNPPPAVLDHLPQQGLGQQKRPGEVDGQHQVPVGALHAHHQRVAGDAGVVDQDLDLAEALEDGFGPGLDGFLVGDIEPEGRRRAAQSLDLRCHLRRA